MVATKSDAVLERFCLPIITLAGLGAGAPHFDSRVDSLGTARSGR